MFTEEDMTYVREQFKRDGMEALIDLVGTPIYRVPCIRIFLLHRNQWLEEINAWATKVANNCDLFLPGNISRNDNPFLFQDIRDFESKYSNEINAEIHNHPTHFSKPETARCGVQESINIWTADRKNKEALDIDYSDELELVIEKLFEMLKNPLRDRGIKLSSLNDCEFIRIARKILPKNPALYEHLNMCVVSERKAIVRCNNFGDNLVNSFANYMDNR